MISIVIPFYRDWERLELLLDALMAQAAAADFPVEIVAIDNDAERPYAPPERFAKVRFGHCAKPGSYAARNIGIGLARGDILIFTDADCIPAPGFLEAMQAFYADPGNAGTLCAGKVTVIPETPGRETLAEAYDCVFGLPQKSYVSRGYAVTANLAVPRQVFSTVGLFDESRFSGGDADLCRRAVKAGFRLAYNEQAEVRHPARRTVTEIVNKARRVVGAQVDRAGPRGAANLIARATARMFISLGELLRSPHRPGLKLRALPLIFVSYLTRTWFTLQFSIVGTARASR